MIWILHGGIPLCMRDTARRNRSLAEELEGDPRQGQKFTEAKVAALRAFALMWRPEDTVASFRERFSWPYHRVGNCIHALRRALGIPVDGSPIHPHVLAWAFLEAFFPDCLFDLGPRPDPKHRVKAKRRKLPVWPPPSR